MMAAMLGTGVAVSGAAALRAILDQQIEQPVASAQPAVLGPAVPTRELAAPAAGVTGTIALPALPSYAAYLPTEAGATAAAPFSTVRASAEDRARALQCLTTAIYYESASESDAGQRAVAQVVLNRVRHPAFPGTVCGVVFQGSERSGCQFSFACDGAMARVPSRTAWARAARNAAAALAGGVYAPVGLATHYHTHAVRPAWNRSLVMTDVVGAHFFHRWKGWWGTATAFRQAYLGGEPAPGPHRPATPAGPAVEPTILVAPVTPVPVQPVAPLSEVAPTLAASGAALTAAPAQDRLPPAPEPLERWKDSGQPLR
jgi:spore germination cell wall hydrolase CwlJ-like protein